MNKFKILFVSLFFSFTAFCQNMYFPPISHAANWDTLSPKSLNWCEDSLNSFYNYLEQNNTKSFIVLKDGKIVIEKYFGGFNQDSFWFWASAGKSLSASLVGIAQQEGLLDIQEPSSKYLGRWTSMDSFQENKIKIVHHLSMSTGLNYNVSNLDCKDPTCLTYLNEPGTAWYYHNAPYLLTHNIVENASSLTFTQFTNTKLGLKTGITGLWSNGVFYSKARVMARFGLWILNKGVWNNDTILQDSNYFNQMVNSSQSMNPAYGYLWWLNGKDTLMLPGFTLRVKAKLIPNAPMDLIAALGKYDQKIYVVPSQNLVVIRNGNESNEVLPGPSGFDNALWGKINNLNCNTLSSELITKPINHTFQVMFDIETNLWRVSGFENTSKIELLSIDGKHLSDIYSENFDLSQYPLGMYLLKIKDKNNNLTCLKILNF